MTQPPITFSLRASNGSQTIDIDLYDSTTVNYVSGTFVLSGSNVGLTGYYGNIGIYTDLNVPPGILYHYATDGNHKGFVTVNIDKIKKRVSGSFSFTATFPDSAGKEIKITSGKFSLPLN